MLETRLQDANNWKDQLPTPEQADLVDVLFPFRTPPLEVAKNCLVITDPDLQLRGGYHDTASSVFLFPRSDHKFLVPAIAFDEGNLPLNL